MQAVKIINMYRSSIRYVRRYTDWRNYLVRLLIKINKNKLGIILKRRRNCIGSWIVRNVGIWWGSILGSRVKGWILWLVSLVLKQGYPSNSSSRLSISAVLSTIVESLIKVGRVVVSMGLRMLCVCCTWWCTLAVFIVLVCLLVMRSSIPRNYLNKCRK